MSLHSSLFFKSSKKFLTKLITSGIGFNGEKNFITFPSPSTKNFEQFHGITFIFFVVGSQSSLFFRRNLKTGWVYAPFTDTFSNTQKEALNFFLISFLIISEVSNSRLRKFPLGNARISKPYFLYFSYRETKVEKFYWAKVHWLATLIIKKSFFFLFFLNLENSILLPSMFKASS